MTPITQELDSSLPPPATQEEAVLDTEAEVSIPSDRPSMDVDIVCAGFGPAMGGFLTALTEAWSKNPDDPAFTSKVAPGMPLQVLCYERADEVSSGVSGVVTRGRGIRTSMPDLKAESIPMAVDVKQERVLYLMDPLKASRRSLSLRIADSVLRTLGRLVGVKDYSLALPWIPGFLEKRGGLILAIGQFNQWVASQLMGTGLVQVWPGSPVQEALFNKNTVRGVRLVDQGVDKHGQQTESFMPGMDVRARLTVVGDGPVGAVGQSIDRQLGMPADNARREWAIGMKMLIELPPDDATTGETLQGRLEPGTVWHTFGYPEPEIFGFMYVHPDRLVSVGIFVPSWMNDPSRTAYRYLQHYIQHPALWRYLKDGTLRSWGAKSLEESGRSGEPYLCGNGFARIGEGSGSTNVLTGSGVDEAWTTGVQLAESVTEILHTGGEFTRGNLEATYVQRRRASWVERGARDAENARAGFHHGIMRGLIGMGLAGLTSGRLSLNSVAAPPHQQIPRAEELDQAERKHAAELAAQTGRPLHDALLTARGWPEIEYDGRLLVSQQDALLLGGKVQAAPGFADHVVFRDLRLCAACDEKTCVAMCSGQAITQGADGMPSFEREKCIHCGACLWNCAKSADGQWSNLEFRAGAGGLHSAEN